MIYLDTHIITTIRHKEFDTLTSKARRALDVDVDPRIGPMVLLELEYLHEIGRNRTPVQEILDDLAASMGLRICNRAFLDVTQAAAKESWTGDPFDRIIVAQARLHDAPLITRETVMQAHYPHAFA